MWNGPQWERSRLINGDGDLWYGGLFTSYLDVLSVDADGTNAYVTESRDAHTTVTIGWPKTLHALNRIWLRTKWLNESSAIKNPLSITFPTSFPFLVHHCFLSHEVFLNFTSGLVFHVHRNLQVLTITSSYCGIKMWGCVLCVAVLGQKIVKMSPEFWNTGAGRLNIAPFN